MLAVIDALPRNTLTSEAMADDEELAKELASQEDRPATGPRISDWTGEREDLAVVIDRLGELANAVIASNGGKPIKIRPYPRPKTKGDTLRQQSRRDAHKDLVARVMKQ